MRTAFTAGALIELHEQGFGADHFDVAVGSSGGHAGKHILLQAKRKKVNEYGWSICMVSL